MIANKKIKEIVGNIAPKYAIDSVFLFGSYARGTATEKSDFDFRIVGGEIRSLYDIEALRLDLEEALEKPVDIVLTDNIQSSFYDEIKKEEVLLYGNFK
jgi:predicted nucleotidyltransferase